MRNEMGEKICVAVVESNLHLPDDDVGDGA